MLAIFFAFGLVLAQFFLPREKAFIPLILSIFLVGDVEVIGQFTPTRLIILAGLARAFAGGFLRWSWQSKLDLCLFAFTSIALLSSLGHEGNQYVPSPLIERIGLVLNILGSYLYARSYFFSEELLPRIAKVMAVAIMICAPLMLLEQLTGDNFFGKLGLTQATHAISRNDGFRAMGPFGHAIIAGTVAASVLPMMILLFRLDSKGLAIGGIIASFIGATASASSGPVVALLAGIILLALWPWRHLVASAKWVILAILVVLNFSMSRPIWFLIARIDIVGGSTGWHRSVLIDTSMKNLNEWWLAGTDYTRHWIHSGVTWNPNHTDITNYYLQMGVMGGLPLMITFFAIIFFGSRLLLRRMEDMRSVRELSHLDDDSSQKLWISEFSLWCIWAAIFMHCLSFISIAYFDQSYALFFLLFGLIPQLCEPQTEDEVLKTNTVLAL